MNALHIGCSSFNNPRWKGVFYPEDLPRSKWFAYYAEHFSTYEINASFYRAPTVKSLQSWYHKAPDAFVFSIKAPRTITHYRRFAEVKELLEDFYSVCRDGLRDKLACVLFQLPPSFEYTPEHLARITDHLDPNFSNVVEFRNATWWHPDVFATLKRHNITFCRVSYPGLPQSVMTTSDVAYVRLHGVPRLFYSGYGVDDLRSFGSADAPDTYIYFNNTAAIDGIQNALLMRSGKF